MNEAPPPRFRPVATLGLFALNAAVFVAELLKGGSLLFISPALLSEVGAVDAVRVWEGEIWRLGSGMFVHGAIWHVGVNLWVLWQVGRVLERALGVARYLLVYFVSGVFGFSASLLFSLAITCGASGAIFGVVGGLFALARVARDQPIGRFLSSALTPFVVANLVLGFLLPFVDNAAHVGGLVAGFLLSYGLLADERGAHARALESAGVLDAGEAARYRPRFAKAATVAAVLLFAAVVPASLRPTFSPRYHTVLGFRALEQGALEAARRHAEEAEALAPADGMVLLLKGRVLLEGRSGERARARQYFAEGLKRLDEAPDVAFQLALSAAGGRDLEQALFRDPLFAAGLCNALLERESGRPSPDLLNNCAWLFVTTDDARVRDVPRALALAQRAVKLARPEGAKAPSGKEEALAAYLHTLAVAYAESGDPEEARVLMEHITTTGLSRRPFYEEERERFARMAKRAHQEAEEEPGPEPEGG